MPNDMSNAQMIAPTQEQKDAETAVRIASLEWQLVQTQIQYINEVAPKRKAELDAAQARYNQVFALGPQA